MAIKKADQILKNAEELYLNKEFDAATDLILESKDLLDPALFHFNLGSLYLKREKLGPARLHLEKAKKEGFAYPMLWKNLSYINGQPQIVDPSKSRDNLEVLSVTYKETSMDVFLMGTLLVFALSLFCFRKSMYGLRTLAFTFILGALPLSFKFYLEKNQDFAVVLNSTRVFEGPSSIYTDLGEVSQGSRVIVSKLTDGWFYIVSPKEFQGWAKQKDLAIY